MCKGACWESAWFAFMRSGVRFPLSPPWIFGSTFVLPKTIFTGKVEIRGIEGDRAEDEAHSRRNPKVESVRRTDSRESVDHTSVTRRDHPGSPQRPHVVGRGGAMERYGE